METEKATKTIIGNDMEITGNIKCSGQIQLDGKLVGDLTCSGAVVIGKTAIIKGNISGDTISINGTVQGNTIAKDRIEMKDSAKVHGDIRAKRLSVEDGVTFVGKSEVNPSGLSSESDHSALSQQPVTTAPAAQESFRQK